MSSFRKRIYYQATIDHWLTQSERFLQLQVESPPKRLVKEQLQRYRELRTTVDLTRDEQSDSTIIDLDADPDDTQDYPDGRLGCSCDS